MGPVNACIIAPVALPQILGDGVVRYVRTINFIRGSNMLKNVVFLCLPKNKREFDNGYVAYHKISGKYLTEEDVYEDNPCPNKLAIKALADPIKLGRSNRVFQKPRHAHTTNVVMADVQ